MNFRIATGNDPIGNVEFLFGYEIDKNLDIPEELEEHTFCINNKKYIGNALDFRNKMGELLSYQLDANWFACFVNEILNKTDKTNVVKRVTPNDNIQMFYAVCNDSMCSCGDHENHSHSNCHSNCSGHDCNCKK